MSFNPHNKKTGYKITIKSANGNTVGFINLSDTFIKAMTGKTKKTVTLEDIQDINNGNPLEYILNQTVSIEAVEPTAQIEAKDF